MWLQTDCGQASSDDRYLFLSDSQTFQSPHCRFLCRRHSESHLILPPFRFHEGYGLEKEFLVIDDEGEDGKRIAEERYRFIDKVCANNVIRVENDYKERLKKYL